MPADDPFRRMLGDAPDLPGRLDAGSVIRRSRRRRMAQRVAIGGVAAVAVIGVVGGVGLGFTSLGFASLQFGGAASSSSASKADSAPEFATGGGQKDSSGGSAPTPQPTDGTGSGVPQNLSHPAGTDLPCPAPAPYSPASAAALRVSVAFPGVTTGDRGTYSEVTLTNGGDSPVAGLTTATTEVILSRAGTLRWVALSSDLGGQGATLSAGSSHTFVGHFDTAVCGTTARSAIPAGQYDAIVLVRVSISGEKQWIVSAPTPVTVP